MNRIIVLGGPRTGKTTWARARGRELGCLVRSTDSLIATHDWSQASTEVARWFDEPGPWIIEGVATARALRKWLAANPGKPFDALVVFFSSPFQVLLKGQDSMAKGVLTVWHEIEKDSLARGIRFEEIELRKEAA